MPPMMLLNLWIWNKKLRPKLKLLLVKKMI